MNWIAEFVWLRNNALHQVVFQLDLFFHPALCTSAGADGAGEAEQEMGAAGAGRSWFFSVTVLLHSTPSLLGLRLAVTTPAWRKGSPSSVCTGLLCDLIN